MKLRFLPLLAVLTVAACTSRFVGTWFDEDGRPLPDGTDPDNDYALVLHVFLGASHCGWQHVVFLHLAWPLGTVAHSGDEIRQYIRDPEGDVDPSLRARLDLDAVLPQDAQPTGFHQGDRQLWLSPSDAEEYVYILGPDGVERWPAATFVPPDRRVGRLVVCE